MAVADDNTHRHTDDPEQAATGGVRTNTQRDKKKTEIEDETEPFHVKDQTNWVCVHPGWSGWMRLIFCCNSRSSSAAQYLFDLNCFYLFLFIFLIEIFVRNTFLLDEILWVSSRSDLFAIARPWPDHHLHSCVGPVTYYSWICAPVSLACICICMRVRDCVKKKDERCLCLREYCILCSAMHAGGDDDMTYNGTQEIKRADDCSISCVYVCVVLSSAAYERLLLLYANKPLCSGIHSFIDARHPYHLLLYVLFCVLCAWAWPSRSVSYRNMIKGAMHASGRRRSMDSRHNCCHSGDIGLRVHLHVAICVCGVHSVTTNAAWDLLAFCACLRMCNVTMSGCVAEAEQ